MSMNHKIDPLNEERSVIDNLIASSQNLMGTSTTEDPVPPQHHHTPLDYQMTASKSKMIMKSRRGRTSFTPGQLSDLETAFTNTHYPDFQTRKDLSNKLKIPDDRIQVWFQNRRAKWRKTQRQQNNGQAPLMTSYRGHQMTGDAASIASQNQEQVSNEIILNYSTRPSPIRHTASLVKSETNFNTGSVLQTSTTNSKTQKQVQYQQQNLGNGINMYEKNITAPHTSSNIVVMPENQRTAPSLYSLSTTVTSSGQYIILGPSNELPTSYPMTLDYNNYPIVHVPSTSHNY